METIWFLQVFRFDQEQCKQISHRNLKDLTNSVLSSVFESGIKCQETRSVSEKKTLKKQYSTKQKWEKQTQRGLWFMNSLFFEYFSSFCCNKYDEIVNFICISCNRLFYFQMLTYFFCELRTKLANLCNWKILNSFHHLFIFVVFLFFFKAVFWHENHLPTILWIVFLSIENWRSCNFFAHMSIDYIESN